MSKLVHFYNTHLKANSLNLLIEPCQLQLLPNLNIKYRTISFRSLAYGFRYSTRDLSPTDRRGSSPAPNPPPSYRRYYSAQYSVNSVSSGGNMTIVDAVSDVFPSTTDEYVGRSLPCNIRHFFKVCFSTFRK